MGMVVQVCYSTLLDPHPKAPLPWVRPEWPHPCEVGLGLGSNMCEHLVHVGVQGCLHLKHNPMHMGILRLGVDLASLLVCMAEPTDACMCLHMHADVCTDMCTYVCAHGSVWMHMYVDTCTWTCAHVLAHVCMDTCKWACTCACTHEATCQ